MVTGLVRYQGIPKLLLLRVLSFQILGKYCLRIASGTRLSSSNQAFRDASWEAKPGFRFTTSGAVFAETAVKILFSIAAQGISTHRTLTPGFSASNLAISLLK